MNLLCTGYVKSARCVRFGKSCIDRFNGSISSTSFSSRLPGSLSRHNKAHWKSGQICWHGHVLTVS